MESPPKRVTRARAAAGVRIVTAAARAKLAGPLSAVTTAPEAATATKTAAKRKTRADDTDGEDEDIKRGNVTRKLRGNSEAAGRPKALPRRLPTRPAPVAAKRTMTRSRSGTLTTKTTTVPTKKAVTFDSPDKENIEPTKDAETGGLRGRPAKRAPVAKDAKKSDAAKARAKPLSPKKVTQMPHSPASSPSKSPVRSPVRGSGIPQKKKAELPEGDVDSTITVNAAILNPQGLTTSLTSPARRPTSSHNKDNTLRSPAKKMGPIVFPPSAVRPIPKSSDDFGRDNTLSFKSSMFQTPAKRPPSPIKGSMSFNFTSTHKKDTLSFSKSTSSMLQSPAKKGMPGVKPFSSSQLCETPAMKTLVVDRRRPSEKLIEEEEEENDSGESLAEQLMAAPIDLPKFAAFVDPKDVNAAEEAPDAGPDDDDEIEFLNTSGLESDDAEVEQKTPSKPAKAAPPVTPVRSYQMYEDESNDEMSSSPMEAQIQVPAQENTSAIYNRRETIGLSQNGSWGGASPIKVEQTPAPRLTHGLKEAKEPSPMKTSFFDDEMQARQDDMLDGSDVLEPEFDDIPMTAEDAALTQEANRMSLGADARVSFDDGLSEASQEYDNENDLPIDPAMLPPVTPNRAFGRSVSTTTLVPLKESNDASHSTLKKGGLTVDSIPSNGKGNLPKSATVISYTPTKEDSTKSLLRGAVVFVDVHTSEGADASGIFVDLLQQMGAKCVKTWTWNPSASSGPDGSNRVGITHVVFKDGGKRTMERVRQAKGLVQCVGVSWVLDCERHAKWLEESPYVVDSSLVPRGGARRRRSMEPKALSDNSTVKTPPSKKDKGRSSRRQSAIWVHTPSDCGDAEQDAGATEEDVEWSKFILTPVPKTPAPETVARQAAELPPMTPSFGDSDDSQMSPYKLEALMRTCPSTSKLPIRLGDGMLSPEKDEQVRLRLMAARRKSMQFAPKIGSPLARTWK